MDLPPLRSALVPLLLLLAVPTPSICCSFGFNPISSTFSTHLNNLTPWLLLDYPVAMPSNLEPDSVCSDLWGLHFGALALQRMLGVAGKDLAPLLRNLLAQLHFVAECHIQDPQRCVRLEMVNVSQLLETLVQHLGGLQGRPLHFPGCARLRCHPGPALTSPAVRHEGLLGAKQGPPSPAGHGLVLLGGVGVALGLVAVGWVLWRRPCAQVGTPGALRGTGDTGEDGVPGDAAGGEGTRGTGGGVCTGDTVDAGCRGDLGSTGGCCGDTGSTGGCLGVTGRRTDNTGSTRERWEVIPLSPPQPSQGPPTWEQDGT
nr:fms-related tyrosine kinase 3 ligand isoform X2 [Taeniopygia guttata]